MKNSLILILTLLLSSSVLFGQCLNSENEFKEYFKKNIKTLDIIEGIWTENVKISTTTTNEAFSGWNNAPPSYYPQDAKWAIMKNGSNFIGCKLEGEGANISLLFSPTATSGLFLLQITNKNPPVNKTNAIINSDGILEYVIEGYNSQFQIKNRMESSMIKLFPTLKEKNEAQSLAEDKNEAQSSSGTGVAITSNGIIATNFHVINGANTIKVRGINGDFNKSLNVRVLVSDKTNDLALVQIDDAGFSTLGTIPYVINSKLSNVGESIFVLGYPLRATMGDEIKLTNGIISSKTGFQGDITSYQISAPVQPGNSGGPLFDSQGNLIGIINAKHLGAENVSYGIKASYLSGLFELLPSTPKLQSISQLNGKTLSSQVDLINKFVYIIEIN